jgi:hypothetical protein
MVYPHGQYRNAFVVHDGDFGSAGGHLRVTVNGVRLTVEPFKNLIDAIVASGWNELTRVTPAAEPRASWERARWFPSELVDLLGGYGNDLAVLAILVELSRDQFHGARDLECFRARDGEPWVALSHAQIERMTGLNASQVKYAVRVLARKGLIVGRVFNDPVDDAARKCHYRVSPTVMERV